MLCTQRLSRGNITALRSVLVEHGKVLLLRRGKRVAMLRHRLCQVLDLRGCERPSSAGKGLRRETTGANTNAAVAGALAHTATTAPAARATTTASAIHGMCARHGPPK